MPDRDVLHSDINCCYAQIECQARPELRGKPVVVGGDEEARHGIVLAKNLIAKRAGVKTAMALWEARKACPGLVVVPPDYRLYMDVSRRAREIYYDYTDRVEPFGPDEAWLDVTGTRRCLGLSPAEIAREVSERMVAELGISVSVGVSWNKIFAKFGSDYKKPDAVTVITRENYREVVWQAPVRDLLYVGPATERKLHSSGIDTIGQLACASDELLRNRLGKMGFVLRGFARGQDATEVKPYDRDAADVMRMGKDLFIQHGLTTNRTAMDWFQRYYPEHRVHAVNFPGDPYPIHIDATFVPLRPGLIINNPQRKLPEEQRAIFEANDWQIVDAAQPAHSEPPEFCYSSVWLSMNCLVLDPKTVIVEASEVYQQEEMDKLGMNVIPVDLRGAYAFGGGLHCSTADVYREGECLDYFPNRVADPTLVRPEMWND